MTPARATGALILACEYPPFPGGIGSYAGALAAELAHAGHAVQVIAPTYPEIAVSTVEDAPGVHRLLRHHGVPIDQTGAILKIIAGTPPDWPILAADIRTVLFLWATRFLHRRAYRAMIHGSEVSKFAGNGPVARVVRRAYRKADAICANSRATLDIFAEVFGTPAVARVTYLGVDAFWSQPAVGSFDHSALAALPAEQAILCSVGRIEPRKGHVETIKALAMARDRWGAALPLFVVAGRPEHPDYAAAVVEAAQASKVPLLMTGRLSDLDLRRLYARARAHTLFAQALPGKLEGFGLVLLEAAAQGCPSIATSVGGIPEVMGSTGVLVPPGDGAAFAQAIAAVVSSPRDAEATKVLSDRIAMFGWADCARRTFPELNW